MTTLYRTYRPKTFAEIEGQEHVVQTLRGALASGNVGHAYFFSGPRGTGKTTMARLFAKTLNCSSRKKGEPCNTCHSCNEINANKSLDLIEIDAASHTSVDNVRDMIDSAQVSAPGGGRKIFIIDEVHMLSKSAFNALLKTLEEPPAHTMFILATTEPHKVPETILSRVQRLDFKKLNQKQIIDKLHTIANAEQLSIDEASLHMLATHASGSMRDAESALAKIISYTGQTITEQQTSELLGIVPRNVHENLLKQINAGHAPEALLAIANLHESGVSLENFSKQFIDYLRSELIQTLNSRGDAKPLVRIIERFILARSEFRHSPIPQLPLELAIVDLTHHE